MEEPKQVCALRVTGVGPVRNEAFTPQWRRARCCPSILLFRGDSIIGERNSSLWDHNRQETTSNRDQRLLVSGQRGVASAGGEAAECVCSRGRDRGAALPREGCATEGRAGEQRESPRAHSAHMDMPHGEYERPPVAFGYACGRERLTSAANRHARTVALDLPGLVGRRIHRRRRHGRSPGAGDASFRQFRGRGHT